MRHDRTRIITMDVDLINVDRSLQRVVSLAKNKHGAYVCLSNVHMCIETLDSLEFREIVNKADLIIPDGKPLSWAQKLLGYHEAEQVRGQDLMNAVCSASGKQGLNIGFYGGSSDKVLSAVKSILSQTYPDIRITYAYSPPFRPLTIEEDVKVVTEINKANVNVLFVGIGCPKQEKWMATHKDKLNCVMLGVGAAYDFIAGTKKHAPRWAQKIGMEWFFRLCSEPKRLWRRYLSTNGRFILNFTKQLIKRNLV